MTNGLARFIAVRAPRASALRARALTAAAGCKTPCPGAPFRSNRRDAHMRRARFVLRRDRSRIVCSSPHADHRIDQFDATSVGEVRIVEAHEPQALRSSGVRDRKRISPRIAVRALLASRSSIESVARRSICPVQSRRESARPFRRDKVGIVPSVSAAAS